MQTINWNTTKAEQDLIEKIARRAMALKVPINTGRTLQDWTMDITATHCNGCALDLARFAGGDDFNFAHDIAGIARHLNRSTGQLEGYFLPRFASRE